MHLPSLPISAHVTFAQCVRHSLFRGSNESSLLAQNTVLRLELCLARAMGMFADGYETASSWHLEVPWMQQDCRGGCLCAYVRS
jgi:hypothetical protein